MLAVYVVLASVMSLRGYVEPRPSYLGMAVLVSAALIMPALAKEKPRLSAMTGSAALRADGVDAIQIQQDRLAPPTSLDRGKLEYAAALIGASSGCRAIGISLGVGD